MGPCAMEMGPGVGQARAAGQYIQPRYGTRAATSSSTCAGFLACGHRSQAASSLSPTWTESVELKKRDTFREIWIVVA